MPSNTTSVTAPATPASDRPLAQRDAVMRLMDQAFAKAATVADLDHTIMALSDLGVDLLISDGSALLDSIGDDAAEDCAQHLEHLAKLIRALLPEGGVA